MGKLRLARLGQESTEPKNPKDLRPLPSRTSVILIVYLVEGTGICRSYVPSHQSDFPTARLFEKVKVNLISCNKY